MVKSVPTTVKSLVTMCKKRLLMKARVKSDRCSSETTLRLAMEPEGAADDKFSYTPLFALYYKFSLTFKS